MPLEQVKNLRRRETERVVHPARIRRLTPQFTPSPSLRGVHEPVVHQDVRLRREQRLRGASRDGVRWGTPVEVGQVRVNGARGSILPSPRRVVKPPSKAGEDAVVQGPPQTVRGVEQRRGGGGWASHAPRAGTTRPSPGPRPRPGRLSALRESPRAPAIIRQSLDPVNLGAQPGLHQRVPHEAVHARHQPHRVE